MNAAYSCGKRDQACIWFAHLPLDVARHLEMLPQNSPVCLLINGHETVWRRMRPARGRATPGIRIEAGKDIWNLIELGSGFTLELISRTPQVQVIEPSRTAIPSAAEMQNAHPLRTASYAMFGAYLFIDYSGAEKFKEQRKAIRIAYTEGATPARVIDETYDRASLNDFIIERLRSASDRGFRICLGQDHAFGIPVGFARELGISHLPWRMALRAFLEGTYDRTAPRFRNVRQFVCEMNRWLVEHGRKPYFWSATKAELYGVPRRDPRRGDVDESAYRLTDRCRSQSGRGRPKPINRVGDPGTVGGQSLLGMLRIRELIERSEHAGIKLRFWPFDGLGISDPEYDRAHVAVEPYPSALRPEDVEQTDDNDALCTATAVQASDLKGFAVELFDLRGLQPSHAGTVRFEGWILGHLAPNDR